MKLTDDQKAQLFAHQNKRKEVSKRLKKFINDTFKTQKEASDYIHTSQTTIKKYFDGVILPSMDVLILLSEAGLDLNWLIHGGNSNENRTNYQQVKDTVKKNLIKHIEKM
jgi:hypothetical protein